MKKWITLLLACVLTFSLTACSQPKNQESSSPEPDPSISQAPEAEIPSSEPQEAPSSEPQEAPSSELVEESSSNMLVAYFSYAENAELADGVDASASASIQMLNGELTGNTGIVAHMIADTTDADIFSIRTVKKYPSSYDATIDLGQEERNADARPELATPVDNLDNYDVIFLGYPNWWGDMPMAMYTFLEEVDFSGKTVVPFVTSGGSGFSSTIRTIENMEQGATIQEGLSLRDSSATGAQEQITEWLSGLGYVQ